MVLHGDFGAHQDDAAPSPVLPPRRQSTMEPPMSDASAIHDHRARPRSYEILAEAQRVHVREDALP